MNKNFSQLPAQLVGVWRQLGLNQRFSLVLTAAAVLAGLAALVFWAGRADDALLYGKLDDAEAAKVIAALDDAKVPYRISRGGGAIFVPSDKVHTMRMQLAAKGIPRGDGVGFEIFDKPNFGISDFVQRANYLRAVQGELARTIAQVDAVESARVMIVMPENRLLLDNKKRPTASVFVRVRGNAELPAPSVNAIRFLVANAVEGLQANHVTVVDNLGNVLSENSEADSIGGLSSAQLAVRKNLELYLAKKAEGMLEKVLGPGQAVVRVAADVNFDSLTRVEEKFDPEGSVLRSSTITDENTDSSTANGPAGGTPGVSANTAGDTNAAAAPVTASNTRKKNNTQQFEVNKTTSNLIQSAGSLKRLSAAVFVAQKVEGTGADRKPVARSKEDLEKLRRIVQSALGIQDGADASRKDEVTLEEMPFNGNGLGELATLLQQDGQKQVWLDYAKTGAWPALGLVVLFLFWRAFKRTPMESIPLGVPVADLNAEPTPADATGNPGLPAPRPRANQPGVVTVDVLNQLIRENPNNMTQAIRTWMTTGKNN
jgi:flagellar M-ring protein FliF